MFVILALLKIGFGQLMTNAIVWFYSKIGLFGLYVGVFLISTFGNFTVIFPVPYTFALIAVATIPGANVFLIGLTGAMGATIGELSAWAIGKSSQEALGDSEKIQRMKKYIDRGWAPALIFIFAATPLPDDAFLIVLGFANYKFKKIFPWMFVGKFCLCAFTAAIPIWLMHIPMNGEFGTWLFNLYNAGVTKPDPSWGDWFLGLFGVNIEAAILAAQGLGEPPEPSTQEIWVSTIMWIATLVIVLLMVSIDWDKIFNRKNKVEGGSINGKNDTLKAPLDKYHPDVVLSDNKEKNKNGTNNPG